MADATDSTAQAAAALPAVAATTPEAVKAAEKAAVGVHKKINLAAAPIRTYLEATVVPVMMQGMQALCKERPENPVEFLAYYLLSHNPQPNTKPVPQANGSGDAEMKEGS
ncbi:Protein dpy-30 [Tetrabaena socialis]|uniref:Protein dpy-30 homolog n=1 Tax=Tetrabaena socialis TaxID=47790 RepID=A0A2J8A158_9CHLO|nr:Protein dpy-30 [Tetrabaena socialis]|eukprot:PNH06254.1 Protein dpy-30 [Tetrabaena socialis]